MYLHLEYIYTSLYYFIGTCWQNIHGNISGTWSLGVTLWHLESTENPPNFPRLLHKLMRIFQDDQSVHQPFPGIPTHHGFHGDPTVPVFHSGVEPKESQGVNRNSESPAGNPPASFSCTRCVCLGMRSGPMSYGGCGYVCNSSPFSALSM